MDMVIRVNRPGEPHHSTYVHTLNPTADGGARHRLLLTRGAKYRIVVLSVSQ